MTMLFYALAAEGILFFGSPCVRDHIGLLKVREQDLTNRLWEFQQIYALCSVYTLGQRPTD